jgi:hypothetical protein
MITYLLETRGTFLIVVEIHIVETSLKPLQGQHLPQLAVFGVFQELYSFLGFSGSGQHSSFL